MKNFTAFLFLLALSISVHAQTEYHPSGNPDKWQFNATPILWLPWVRGNVEVTGVSREASADIQAAPIDLLKSLKFAADVRLDVSKKMFTGFSEYMYMNLESEAKTFQSPRTGETLVATIGSLKMNVWEGAVGVRLRYNKIVVDPFFGVRYVGMHPFVTVDGINSSKAADKKYDFWDPMFGLKFTAYPMPRFPLAARADIGGMTGGKFSWNVLATAGYTVSPLVDLTAGFRAYGFEYVEESDNITTAFKPIMFGFEVGATFFIPKREKSAEVFPKKEKKEKK